MKAPILQCDVDMAVFLATRFVHKVAKERPEISERDTWVAEYDATTEQNRRFLRGEGERDDRG